MRTLPLALAALLSVFVVTESYADFTFPPQDNGGGGYQVFAGTSTVINLNDAFNGAAVPTADYKFFSVTADWTAGGGGPWSSEARISFNLNGGTTSQFAPGNGASNGNPTTLVFNGGFGAGNAYNPSVDPLLDILLDQTFGGSDANWNNIVVTLIENTTPPTTDGSVTTNGGAVPGNFDTFSTAYDGAVQNLYWLEYTLTNDAASVVFDTEGTTGVDTEIGVYDADGNLLGNDDDGGSGLLSSLTLNNLTAGTYYVVAGGFNVTFGAGFGASSSDTSDAGTLVMNVTAIPEPSAIGLLALAGIGMVIRRRR